MLGLDIGEKRIGVAVSDPGGRVAHPVAVLDAVPTLMDGVPLARLLADYDDVGCFVIGLPLSLDGTEGPQAARVRAAAERLAHFLPFPQVFADERLSSAAARRTLREAGLSEREQRGRVDMVAAAIFLQTYLDEREEREV